MRRNAIAAELVVLCLGISSRAIAQDHGRVGLTMGYPAAVGLMIHVSDQVALRPEFTFSQSSIDTDITVTGSIVSSANTADAWGYGVGVSALFYVGPKDNLRTYFSPRFQYLRASTDTTLTSMPGGTLSHAESKARTFAVSGAFAAQYSIGPRFTVFGEIGAVYSDVETKSPGTGLFGSIRTTTTNTGFGIRTGAGVILYF